MLVASFREGVDEMDPALELARGYTKEFRAKGTRSQIEIFTEPKETERLASVRSKPGPSLILNQFAGSGLADRKTAAKIPDGLKQYAEPESLFRQDRKYSTNPFL